MTLTRKGRLLRRGTAMACLGGLIGMLLPCYSWPAGSATGPSDSALVIEGVTVASPALWKQAKGEGQLSVYSGAGKAFDNPIREAFQKATGIHVSTITMVPDQLQQRIQSEVGGGRFGADVVMTSDAAIVLDLKKAGVWGTYQVPSTLGVDKSNMNEGGLYYTFAQFFYTIAYNTQLVKGADIPTSWRDLVNPKWQAKVGIVQVGAGGSTAALTRFMVEKFGWDYLEAYARNKARVFSGAAAQLTAIARGEISVGTNNNAFIAAAIKAGQPVGLVVPKEGMAGYQYYAGVARSAKNSAAAKVFVNWLMTKPGQTVVVGAGAYSVRADMAAPSVPGVSMPRIGSDLTWSTPVENLVSHKTSDQERWNQIFRTGI